MRERTDDSLLLATARGDETAFAELVARHRPRLVRYATSRCGRDVGLAEDAVQDGLVRAHRAILGGKVPVDVEAWLYAIVRNRCHDYFRAAKPTAPALKTLKRMVPTRSPATLPQRFISQTPRTMPAARAAKVPRAMLRPVGRGSSQWNANAARTMATAKGANDGETLLANKVIRGS